MEHARARNATLEEIAPPRWNEFFNVNLGINDRVVTIDNAERLDRAGTHNDACFPAFSILPPPSLSLSLSLSLSSSL